MGTSRLDDKGEFQEDESFKEKSTDARNWDGVIHISEEMSVMDTEQRNYVRQSNLIFN